jgi:hypothetical protein
MVEQLRALEERLRFVQQEYRLACERHEFLAQYDLHEELERLRRMRRELKMKMTRV